MTTFLPLIHPNPADFGLLGSASIGLGSVVGAVRLALAANGVAVGAGTAAAAAAVALTALGTGQGVGGAAGAIQAVLSKAGIAAGVGAAHAAVTALLSLTGAASGVGAVSGATLDVLSKAGTAAGLGAAAAAAIDTFLASGTAAGLGSATPAAPLWVPPQFAAAALYINWTQPAPDGTFGMAWLGSSKVAKAANLIVSRTGTGGTAFDPSGNVVSFTGTALRATNAGLTTEEARTNSATNNTMVGAVPGTPGTAPTGWSIAANNIPSRQVVATGTLPNGLPYIDLRYFGTPTGTTAQIITMGNVAGVAGQTWTQSVYVALVAGSFTNVSALTLRSGSEAGGTVFTPTSIPTRYTNTRTLTSTDATLDLRWVFNDTTTPVDFTLRIAGNQTVQGTFATTLILTSSAAVTRAQDFISFSDVSWLAQGQGSLYVAASLEGISISTSARVFGIDDGTFDNVFDLFANPNNEIPGASLRNGGVSQFGINGTSITLGAPTRWAGAFASPSDGGFSQSGTAGTRSAAAITVPTFSAAHIGSAGDASRPVSGVITEVAYFPTALSNAQLQAITSPPSWVPAVFANADLYINWAQPVGDGTYGMAWLGPTKTAKAASLLVSRTGTGGTVLDASGNVVSVTGTALRANSAGLVTEEPRTNQVRNNTMAGAAFDNTNLLTTAGWTMGTSGGTGTATNSPAGTLNLTGDGANAAKADQSFTTVVGRVYTLNFTVATNQAGLVIGTTQGGSQIFTSVPALGTNSLQFTATATTTWVGFFKTAASLATVSAISLQWAGTLPTNWTQDVLPSGVTQTVVGTGTVNGLPYVDLQIAGTPAATGGFRCPIFDSSFTPAATGQAWTTSAFMGVAAGAFSNVTIRYQFNEYNSTPASVLTDLGPTFTPTSTLSRFSYSPTFSGGATVVSTRVSTLIGVTFGQPIGGSSAGVTLRIAAPQLELGSFATTPILTSGAAVTRAQDFISFSDVSWLVQGPGTIYGAQSTESVPAATNVVFSLDDGTFNNDVIVMVSSVAQQAPLLRLAGVAQTVPSGGAIVAANTPYKQAFAFAPNDLGFGYGGSASARVTGATLPSVTAVHVGMAGDGSRVLSGTITELAYFAAPLTNAQLQAITT